MIKSSLKELGTLKKPSFKKVEVYKNLESPTYFNYSMVLPYRFSFPHPESRVMIEKDFDTTKAVILHEVGHGVFDHNFRLKNNDWKKYKEGFVAYRPVRKECQSLRGDFEWGIYNRYDHPKKHEQLQKLEGQMDEFEAFFKSFPFDDFVTSYEELFADTFTVFTLNNPSAISETMYFSSNGEDYELLPALFGRDFSLKHPIEGYFIDGFDSSKMTHIYFSHVRSYLYQNFDIKKDRVKALSLLYAAIEKEVEERARTPSLHQMDIIEANQRLIDRIKSVQGIN